MIYQPPAQCITAYITCRPHPLPHSSPRNIDLSTLSSTLHVSWYILLLHAHRDASGQTRDIACDKFAAPRFTIFTALHRQPAIGASGSRRFDRRSNGRTTATGRVEQEKRRKHRAQGSRSSSSSLSTQTHLQCHRTSTPTTTPTPYLQANQSRLPCPLPLAPGPLPPPRQSIIPSTPARWAETPWASIQHPWLFLERGVDRQHSFASA